MASKGGRRGRTRAPPQPISRSPSPGHRHGHVDVKWRGPGYLELAEMAEKGFEARRAHRRRRSSRTRSCEKNSASTENGRHEEAEGSRADRQLPLSLEATAAGGGSFDEKHEEGQEVTSLLEGHNSYGDNGPNPNPDDHLATMTAGSNNETDGEKLVENNSERQKTFAEIDPKGNKVNKEEVGGNIEQDLEQEEEDGPSNLLILTEEKLIDQQKSSVVVTEDNQTQQNFIEDDDSSQNNKISENDFNKDETEVSSSGELDNFPRLSLPQLDFSGSVTEQIDFQHRKNMGYLDAYLDRIVDGTMTSAQHSNFRHSHRRLIVTPQLPPEVSLTFDKIEALPPPSGPFQSQFEEEEDGSIKIKPLLNPSFDMSSRGRGRKLSYFESIKKTFALVSSKFKINNNNNNDEEGQQGLSLARVKSVFEKNRTKNKARPNSYAITFGFKLKQSQVDRRRRRINLFRFENLLRSKNKEFGQHENHGKNLTTFQHQDEKLVTKFPESQYHNNKMQSIHNSNETGVLLPNQDLHRSKFFDDDSQNSTLSSQLGNAKKYTDIFNNNDDDGRHFQPQLKRRVVTKGRHHHHDQNYLPESTSYSLSSSVVSPFLENSSKLSEKTQSLLQKARSSSSAVQTPAPSSGQHSKKSRNNKSGKFFNENTLTKIYTPKTEFTRQFASLLPSWNVDKFF